MLLSRRSRTHRGNIDLPEDNGPDGTDFDHDLMRALSQVPPAKIEKVDESFVLLDSGLGAIFSAAMARRAAVERLKLKPHSPQGVLRQSSERSSIGKAASPRRAGRSKTAVLLRRAADKFRVTSRKHAAEEATMRLFDNMEKVHKIGVDDMEKPATQLVFDSDGGKADEKDGYSSSEEIAPSAVIEHDESVRKWARDNLRLAPDRLAGLEESGKFRSKLRHQMLCWEALRADKLLPPGVHPLVPGAVEFIEEIGDPLAKAGEYSVQGIAHSMTKDASTSSLTTRASPTSVATEDSVANTGGQKNTAVTEAMSPKFHEAAKSLFSLTRHTSSMSMRRSRVPPAAFYKDDGPESQRSEGDVLFGGVSRVPEWPGRERLPVLALEGPIEPDKSEEPERKGSSILQPDRSNLLASLPRLSCGMREQAVGPQSAGPKAYDSISRTSESGLSAGIALASARMGSDRSSPNTEIEVLAEGGSKWSMRLGSYGQAADAARPSFALRLPPPFIEPHRKVMSTDVGKTPELAYFRRCEAHGLIPCPAVWSKFGDGIVNASRRTLGDSDVKAIVETAVERAAAGYALLSLDLSHNLITDAGIEKVMRLLSEPWTMLLPAVSSPRPALSSEVPGIALKDLSFAGNRSIRFTSDLVLDNLCRSFSVLKKLTQLDLSGIQARCGTMVSLCSALESTVSLKVLRLVNCGLGSSAGQQEDCIAVAGLLGQRPGGWQGLLSADLSWNFFNRSGFAAAAAALRQSRLVSLSFAGNGSMLSGIANPYWQCGGKDVHFHPMQLLMEGLMFNNTLQTLDFSNCCIGPDSTFVLEDALTNTSSLSSMDMSENPLGAEGLRCLIRLLTRTGTHMRVVGMRDAESTSHRVKFRFSQPNRIYRLNLRYPQERAILRTLLRISAGIKASVAKGSALRHFKFEKCQAKPCVEKDVESDRWITPTNGVYNFTFQPPMSQTAQRSIMVRNSELQMLETAAPAADGTLGSDKGYLKRGRNSERRNTATSRKNSIAIMLGGSDSQIKVGFRTGVGCDHHRMTLLAENPGSPDAAALQEHQGATARGPPRPRNRHRAKDKDALKITDPAKRAARAAAIDWQEVEGLLSESRIRISALRFPLIRSMFLALGTEEQQDRFIHACSRDLSFNFTQVMQLRKDRPEVADRIACALFPCVLGRTSQLLLLGAVKDGARVCKEVAQYLWFQEGNLTGRYHLDLLKPADYAVAESCLLVNAWESEVGRVLCCPDVSQRGNYEMLRNESWNEEAFTYSRDWSLPNHGFLKFDYSSLRRPAAKMAAMSEAGEVTNCLQKNKETAAIKLRALRAVSVHIYLSTGQFRNLIQCFPMGAYRRDFFCMFHTRVVDLSRFLGPELLYSPSVFSPKDCASLLKRVGFLHLLNPLVPEGPRFVCNLAVYEERMVVDFFVQLSKEEPGGRVLGALPDDPEGPVHSVPASWADKGVPCDQENITCCYDTTNPNMSWRLVLAERYCVGMFMTPHGHHDHHHDEGVHPPAHPH